MLRGPQVKEVKRWGLSGKQQTANRMAGRQQAAGRQQTGRHQAAVRQGKNTDLKQNHRDSFAIHTIGPFALVDSEHSKKVACLTSAVMECW